MLCICIVLELWSLDGQTCRARATRRKSQHIEFLMHKTLQIKTEKTNVLGLCYFERTSISEKDIKA